APGGEVIVLTPQAGHLDELREPLGILGVEEGKVDRMYAQAEGHLEQAADPVNLAFPIQLDKESIAAQVAMSPSARHISAEALAERTAALPPTMSVTAHARLDRLRAVYDFLTNERASTRINPVEALSVSSRFDFY